MISQEQIEKLENRIKRYLIVNLGKRLIDANDENRENEKKNSSLSFT